MVCFGWSRYRTLIYDTHRNKARELITGACFCSALQQLNIVPLLAGTSAIDPNEFQIDRRFLPRWHDTPGSARVSCLAQQQASSRVTRVAARFLWRTRSAAQAFQRFGLRWKRSIPHALGKSLACSLDVTARYPPFHLGISWWWRSQFKRFALEAPCPAICEGVGGVKFGWSL